MAPFTGFDPTYPSNLTQGTMGLGTLSAARFRVVYAGGPEDPNPAEDEHYRTVFRTAIYWDGDGNPPVEYTDRPQVATAGALSLVTAWGDIVRTAKGLTSFDDVRVTFSNVEDAGGAGTGQFEDNWSQLDPPEGKRVEIEVQLFDATPPDPTWHLLFTGRIAEVPRVAGDQVTLIIGNDFDRLDRNLLTPITAAAWPSAPPASLGLHEPLVFGDVTNSEAVMVDPPLRAVLSSSLTSVSTSISIEEDPGFDASGTVRIDSEEMTYSAITPGMPAVLTGVVRGVNSTEATDHPVGATVMLLGPVLYVWAGHPCTGVGNVRLVDQAGQVRQLPAGISVVIDESGPTTIELSGPPVLGSSGSSAEKVFRFVDMDTADPPTSGTANTSPGFLAAEVEAMALLAPGYEETNFVVLHPTDPTLRKAAVYRVAGVTLPAGATINAAWAVVEHYLEVPAEHENTLNGAISASDTTILLDSTVAGMVPLNGRCSIGEEALAYAAATDTPSPRLTGCVRGQGLIGALAHPDDAKLVQSALVVSVKDPSGGGLTIAPTDVEGFGDSRATPPSSPLEALGLQTISKGFENEHTHTVDGSHTHNTDTDHTHQAGTEIDWTPTALMGRRPSSPGGPCVPPEVPVWTGLETIAGAAAAALDGNVSTAGPWVWDPSITAPGVFYVRGTAADASPNDARAVTSIECICSTSRANAGGFTPGEVTLTWGLFGGGGTCAVGGTVNTADSGTPRLNIGDNLNVNGFTGTVGGATGGNVANLPFDAILETPSTYVANPNTIFTRSQTIDVSALGLTVRDFVDSDFGGSVAGQHCWMTWKPPNIDVHVLKFRLTVDAATGSTEILDPIDTVPWEDTESASPLKTSTLSWFDLSPKVTSGADLVAMPIQVEHTQQAPFTGDVKVLRVMYVLELANVVLTGDSETPTRVVADGRGILEQRFPEIIFQVITNADLLNESLLLVDNQSVIDTFLASEAASGTVYDQITAAALISQVSDEGRVSTFWSVDGVLFLKHRANRGAPGIEAGSHAATITEQDLIWTGIGPVRARAPLRDLTNHVVVRGGYDGAAGAFTLVSEVTDATSVTNYGVTSSVALDGQFVSTQQTADWLSAHLLDYGKDLPDRWVLRCHLSPKTVAVELLDQIQLDSLTELGQEAASHMVVERIRISPGSGERGVLPFIEFSPVDRD